jgi:hypothetical protein
MPKVQLKCETVLRKGRDPEVLVKINLLPRGGGNRTLARRVGRSFKRDEPFASHVTRVRVGSSSVWVYMRPSFELMWVIWGTKAQQVQDVPGQLKLFGMEVA